MAEKTKDRRTQRTQHAICAALAELLKEKPLNKITIQEISEKADINRATFYHHYQDVYDLYDKLEENTLLDLGMLTLQLQEMSAKEAFSQLIDYIYDHQTLFQMIFSPNTTGTLRAKADRIMEGLFRQMQIERKGSDSKDKKLEYLSCYRAHGCLSILAKWVNSGMQDSKEFIIRTASELDRNMEHFFMTMNP